MSFNEIMHEITGGLTGDPKNDFKYLNEQMEKYKEHEYNQEILRAIGRMMFEILPSDKREEFSKLIDNDQKGTANILEEIKFQMYNKNLKKALELFQSLVKDLNDKKDIFPDDKVSEFHCFQNFLEELIYKVIYNPTKELRRAPEDMSFIYFLYGNLLLEMKNYDDAYTALTKAEKYNCISTDIKFERGEIFKIRKDWDNYLENNRKCLQCAYSSKALARAYRNFAFYYSDIENYDTAIALLFLSTHYDRESPMAQSELMYISDKTGKKIERPTIEAIKEILDKENIQLGCNPVILEICATLGNQAKNEHPEAALFFLSTLYDLISDEGVKKIIDELEAKLPK